MPISSLVVQVKPGEADAVTGQINQLDGAMATNAVDDRIVAVTETSSRKDDQLLWEQLEAISGVIHVSLIYHNQEDLEEVCEK